MRARVDTIFLGKREQVSHSRLGASGSSIWLNCESAPALALTCPPRVVGDAARVGTVAHWLGEQILRDAAFIPPKQVVLEGQVYDVTLDLMLAVSVYVAYAQDVMRHASHCGIETRIDLAPLWAPLKPSEPVYGTADFWALMGDLLEVVDYKNGRGKFVSPVENSQAMFYALGVYLKLAPALARRVRRIKITIVQPNAEGDPIRSWTIAAGDLIFWGYAVLKPAVDRILTGVPGPFVAGTWCWFCAAGPYCETRRQVRQQHAIEAFPVWDEEGECDAR
jgi:Protein of unknown function (DUF2800)